MAVTYGVVSLLCTLAMVHYTIYKSNLAFIAASVLAATQFGSWIYIHTALHLPHFEPVCFFFWFILLGSLKMFDFVNSRMGSMHDTLRRA